MGDQHVIDWLIDSLIDSTKLHNNGQIYQNDKFTRR